MSGRRLVKQLVYGSVFAAFLFLIGFSAYNSWFKSAPTCSDRIQNQNETGIDCGGPCPACAIKDLVNFKVNQAQIKYFSADPEKKTTVFYFELPNLNLNYGADFFYYYFDLFDKNGKEFHITDSSSIYAGGINYIVKLAYIPYDSIASVSSVDTTNINWKIKNEFSKPDTSLRDIETSALQDGGVIVTGFAQNNEAFALSKILISAVLANKNGVKISASKTELENTPAFTEKQFKLNFPKNIFLAGGEKATNYYSFQQDLTLGATGDDVKKLQEILRGEGFLTSEANGNFDQATKNALIQYQKKSKISPASGVLDPKTRDYINALKKPLTAPLSQLIDLTKADPSKTEVYIEGIR
ncbi:MAG: peptidoglycan-binding protein [Spirochaetia bacterium]|nr:MAG: peptidoglycan-binding protein [Spirochaetia bacterium]